MMRGNCATGRSFSNESNNPTARAGVDHHHHSNMPYHHQHLHMTPMASRESGASSGQVRNCPSFVSFSLLFFAHCVSLYPSPTHTECCHKRLKKDARRYASIKVTYTRRREWYGRVYASKTTTTTSLS